MGKQMTAALCAALVVGMATANNLRISNLEVKGRDNSTALIKFDIAWENSWRFADAGDPLYFHDAAWVFFKVKPDGKADWEHARLAGAGVNPPGFETGEGTTVELAVPADGMGLFVRRAADGVGTTAVQKVAAVWDFTANGLAKTDKVRIQAAGLEVCYVAEGAFKVGDGQGDMGQFEDGQSGQPYAITNASQEILLGGGAPGTLNSHQGTGMNTKDDFNYTAGKGALPPDFPTGYNAFYCMKYQVTQGQYADFLNTLTRQQQATRCSATTVGNYMSDANGAMKNRNTVRVMEDSDPYPRVYTNASPDRACNWLSWADLTAFLAWSGLRPLTELEFEKACRGPLEPVAGEFAWGNTAIKEQTGHSGADGGGSEEPVPADANCCFNNKMGGPVRAGIYARANSTRERSGASYWGIMELSGNVWERTVSVGNATGRNFTGTHGNGTLLANGEASVALWPNATATGAGYRGGAWYSAASYARAADRNNAAHVNANRSYSLGGRGGLSAPSGVVGP